MSRALVLVIGLLAALLAGCGSAGDLDTKDMASKIARDANQTFRVSDITASCAKDSRTRYRCFLTGAEFNGTAVLPVDANPNNHRFYYRLADAR